MIAVRDSSLILYFALLLFFHPYCFTQEFLLEFGSKPNHLSPPNEAGSTYELPYPMRFHKSHLYVLDTPAQKIVKVLKATGTVVQTIDLKSKDILKYGPFDDFLVTEEGQWILLSRTKAKVVLYRLSDQRIKLIEIGKNSTMDMRTPDSLHSYQNRVYIHDVYHNMVCIFSKRGNFLGFLPSKSTKSLPYSPTQIFHQKNSKDQAVIESANIQGKRSLFFGAKPLPEDEFLQFEMIGLDESRNLYINELSGPTHGIPKCKVLQVNTLGKLKSAQICKLNHKDLLELKKRFLVDEKGNTYQIHLSKPGFLLKSIELVDFQSSKPTKTTSSN